MSHSVVDAVLIGSSAGGPPTLQKILGTLPVDFPTPIVVIQHMPVGSTAHLAHLLDNTSNLAAREAEPGDVLMPGTIYVAPAGRDITFTRVGRRHRVCLAPPSPGSMHSPSIDKAFRSAADTFGHRLLGVLMTGMGEDGAHGLLEIRKRGGRTIAEAESSAVVYGMPKAAAELLAAQEVRDVSEVSARLIGIVTGSAP